MAIFVSWRRYKPGHTCPQSGQWTDSSGNQITMVRGEIFPPTQRSGMSWKLTDQSRGHAAVVADEVVVPVRVVVEVAKPRRKPKKPVKALKKPPKPVRKVVPQKALAPKKRRR